ncbi:hypothetical protein D9757_002502 [Collybiopsis confluens]|uniref:Arrestin-like N-terminal domain-containing protein n=1 Tax=Collybiopsis confluens TaxID=2823264 RepID=A0A8H5HY65_9AGAR|nr:hypothetical protein D9757_002502 [Collybiopsis confluens]
MYDSPPMYDSSELPAYSAPSAAGRSLPPSALNLTIPREPAPSAAEFIHNLSFKGKNPKSCASLVLYDDVGVSKHLPTYMEGSKLNGLATVSLENPESINTVTVSIRGQIVSGSSSHPFFEFSQILWSNASSCGKLQGEHTWPFTIRIPREITLTVGPNDSLRLESARLPHDCLDRRAPAGVEYHSILRFGRSSPLKADYRIIAPFGYIPVIRPPPLSHCRQVAYRENVEIPGPIADPQGWRTLPPARVGGRWLNQQLVEATCTLSLALPLTYTRGSVIPLNLTIQCRNLGALEALSSPNSIVCRLRRTVRYLSAEDLREINTDEKRLGKFQHDHFDLASWWTPSAQLSEKETFRRNLCGEIVLPPNLKPTTFIGRFRLEYSVVLFSFDSVGFEPSGDQNILLTHPVQIATAFAPGPLPKSYAPESSF